MKSTLHVKQHMCNTTGETTGIPYFTASDTKGRTKAEHMFVLYVHDFSVFVFVHMFSTYASLWLEGAGDVLGEALGVGGAVGLREALRILPTGELGF